MKYLRKIGTKQEYNKEYFDGGLPFPHVCLVGDEVVYAEKFVSDTDERSYMYIEAIEDLQVSFSVNPIQYSIDSKTWVELPVNTLTPTINAGNKVYFKANDLTATSANGIGSFTITGKCNVGGNAMSMVYGDYFVGRYDLRQQYVLSKLFYAQSNIINANRLILPATDITGYCYSNMFYKCTGLVSAPNLTAKRTASNSYYYMFYGCTSLVTAPEISATYVADNACSYMFYGCTSLVNTPKLPATYVGSYGYYYMFAQCTSIVDAPVLPATTLHSYSYACMFYGCTSLTNAPTLPATTLGTYSYYYMFFGCVKLTNVQDELPAKYLDNYCYSYMFYGCTSLVTAPELPAKTLAYNCYNYMFYGCSSLTTAPELPATNLYSNCYSYMFHNCTSLVTAPILPATTLASSCYSYMFTGCVNLNYIKMLATDITASQCMLSWVSGVAPTGIFIKNPEATWDVSGTNGVPSGWIIQTEQ